MFEITGDDIAALSDTDLRTLVGLLCEAEMRRRGLAVSAVTYGGSQDAKDGGLDVRVSLPAGTAIDGFVPKPDAGFQVKKPDMPRAEILKEMKPKGVLRPVILELAAAGGAYIIVSSTGATSESALTGRRKAMAEAIKGTAAEGKLILDFYDRTRVATWVRDHAGLIPWVRSRIGKATPAWQGYGSWSLAPAGADASYLADEHARIRTDGRNDGDGLSATEGINRIRKVLADPRKVVRLVGLSGVGKTRLAEALFDAKVGDGALDPSLAIYTNEADGPNPPPAGLASDLVAARTRAILVVDNCTPELHRRLSEVARADGSTISVITIEYDIKDDQPEGTDVFKLETSSIPLIEKLVARRYPDLSQIDAQTIAEFSGGNARIALALASRIEKTETVAGLSDEELFKRLFQQRHDPDPSLHLIAQACSLVYSFDGETVEGNDAELGLLGSLVGKTADEMYAGVSELKRRDLVQARASWRAVLPHAIANRLAKMALQNIPPAKVTAVLINGGSERLLRSFSRRLGYLDDSKEAEAIVKDWLAPNGFLGEVTNFNELGRAMFTNIAPVAPGAVLAALENALSGADEATLRSCTHFVRLLRALAYEPAFFERALALLVKFAALSASDDTDTEAAGVLESLFHITISGTHAPIAARVKAADALLGSDDARLRALGVKALEALMKTSHFSSHYDFDFGARSRDFGYHPRTNAEAQAWYDAVLELARKYALPGSPVAAEAQKALAREFRGLWTHAGRGEELDGLARDIAAAAFWRDGWIAARQTRIYDGKAIKPDLRDRLTALEEFLRPKDLVSKVRGLVIGPRAGSLDLDDFDNDENEADGADETARYSARAARSAAAVRELGQDLCSDEDAFKAVLPELMAGSANVFALGMALAEAAENLRATWDAIVTAFAAAPQPSAQLLNGYLRGLQQRDPELADALLDEALEHPTLATWFPVLQSSVEIDERALARLHRALELGKADITSYYNLAYGRATDNVPGPEFRDLVLAIARKPGGCAVGLEMVSMRLHADRSDKRDPLPEVREAGRIVLDAFEFSEKGNRTTRQDYELGIVAKASLAGADGAPVARRLCRRLMTAAAKHAISGYDYDDLLKALLAAHPYDILDELFPEDAKTRRQSVYLLNNLLRFHKTVLDEVPDEVILTWCDRAPAARYPLATSVVPLFKRPKDREPHEWTPLTGKLLEKAPDPHLVLNEIINRLHPTSWGGSLATKLEGRLKLLNTLPGGDAPSLAPAVAQAKTKMEAQIVAQRRREQEEDRARSNKFE
ncbi:hypothetical protein [Bradyrhizobium aeschynomenes]|uniref:hypothetical protein n=1 Tax=Bradyrhizobium aeschynomenes TaxID=2734909 RepID=UPI001552D979|nr:hypothetical protein [Bradyrhizobium aeschynomenes]NPV20373.1 hypothetical protein [Bradyrhizobium aeschynomenes]